MLRLIDGIRVWVLLFSYDICEGYVMHSLDRVKVGYSAFFKGHPLATYLIFTRSLDYGCCSIFFLCLEDI